MDVMLVELGLRGALPRPADVSSWFLREVKSLTDGSEIMMLGCGRYLLDLLCRVVDGVRRLFFFDLVLEVRGDRKLLILVAGLFFFAS